MVTAGELKAEKIPNKIAVFAALDKVTARIKRLEVPIDTTIKFGSLKVTPRACFSRPSTETPKTTSFVEVDEILLENKEKRLFTGWMFAESPGISGVEHPVFDVWLTGCGQPTRVESGPVKATGARPSKRRIRRRRRFRR